MGCLFSCLGKNGSTTSTSESEMVNTTSHSTDSSAIVGKEMSRKMSNPTVKFITTESDTDSTSSRAPYRTVSGSGLALACISIEQDSAYWEWHIQADDDLKIGVSNGDNESFFEQREELNQISLKFGLATSKSRKFYRILAANDEGGRFTMQINEIDLSCDLSSRLSCFNLISLFFSFLDDVPMEDDGTALMRSIPDLKNGDVVGVAVQQSDLPMIQFLVNGEPMHHLAINRFRGTVYPSIWLPPALVVDDDDEEDVEIGATVGKGQYTVSVVFEESKFKELAPHARFGPIIVARGII